MQELFPLAAGALIGLLVQRLRASTSLKVAMFVGLCIVFGSLASWISGELEVSWGFISVDMALVWLGGLVSVGLIAAWRRRSTITR
jgi:hypothetical protein